MNLTQQHQEAIASNSGALPPDLAAQLLESMGEGETVVIDATEKAAAPAAAATPGASDATDGKTPPAAEAGTGSAGTEPKTDPAPAGDDKLDASNAVILAKDGKHTIEYEKLVEAREQASTWKQAAQDATRQLEELRAKLNDPAAAGKPALTSEQLEATAQAAVDQGIDPAVFGDFSDSAIVKGIQTVIDQRMKAIESQLAAKLAPLAQAREVDANEAHRQAILSAHPDAASIAQSRELRAWIDSHPSFVRKGFDDVLDKGSAAEVNELFDAYKKATGATTAKPSGDAVAAAAAAAIAKAKDQVPNSLTDIPGGRPGASASREEVMAALDGPQMIEALADLNPGQIETFMNRRV